MSIKPASKLSIFSSIFVSLEKQITEHCLLLVRSIDGNFINFEDSIIDGKLLYPVTIYKTESEFRDTCTVLKLKIKEDIQELQALIQNETLHGEDPDYIYFDELEINNKLIILNALETILFPKDDNDLENDYSKAIL